jgi:flagellar hook-associated protein 1 FlgK
LQAILTIKDSQYDAYSALVGKLAVQSGQAKADVTSATQLEQQISDKVSSVSGVNSDEEGIKLMAFTRAYQANAKVISTADQLFDSLLGMF